MTLPADTMTSNGSVMPRAGRSSSARSLTSQSGPGIILPGCLNQHRVDVDTNNV